MPLNSIDRRALLARVNRRLSQRGERLFKSRGRSASKLGRWFCVNVTLRQITGSGLELSTLARKIGALSPWETVIEDQETTGAR